MSDKSYKILAFDFNTNALKDIYHKGIYTGAYNDFEQFLKDNKFDKHPEGSFYISSVKMDEIKVELIIKKARKTFDWFKYGVKDMRIANLESSEFSNLTHIAQNGKNEKEYDELARKTQETRRQKQLEAIESYKLKNETSTPSKNIDKER